MAKQSSVNLDITNNADGFDISGGTTVRKLGITGGDVTIAGSGSATVTFPTTSTTIAGLGITQSFSALQSFSAGISAAGGVTLAGTLTGVTATFSGNLTTTGSLTTLGEGASAVLNGITSYDNDRVAIVGDYYESTFRDQGGSTSAIISTFAGANSIRVTINCYASTFSTYSSKTHVFNIACRLADGGSVNSFDYTESIVGSFWPDVVFTLSNVTTGFTQIMAITASTPALTKGQSNFYFETSIVRVSV